MKTIKEKEAIVEQLKKNPIIQVACEKSGVSRATFYRWMKTSKKFSTEVENALADGRGFISDIAESQIFSLIKEKKIEAIKYWLSHNNSRYTNKLELSGTITSRDVPLTPAQKKIIKKALKLSALSYDKD